MCQKKEQIDLPQMFLNHHSSNIKQCVSEPILILRNAAAEPISGPARDHGVLENLFAGTTPAPATQSQITTTAFLHSKVRSICESSETCNSDHPDPIDKVERSRVRSQIIFRRNQHLGHLLKLLSLNPNLFLH